MGLTAYTQVIAFGADHVRQVEQPDPAQNSSGVRHRS